MRKTFNVAGDAAYKINTEHIVTADHFINALAQYCWQNDIEFNPKMKKTDGVKILKDSLFHYGIRGEIELSLYEGANDEAVKGYEDALPLAKTWVLKNYPYLEENYYDGK